MKINLFAQDSLHVYSSGSSFFIADKQMPFTIQERDTLQNQFFNYFNRNRMGSVAAPDYPLLLSNKDYDLGALWFKSPYDNAAFALADEKYFTSKKIATSIFGAAGSKKEQILKLSHVQNVTEDLNFSLKLNRFVADNFYQYQQSFVNNVLFSSYYLSKKHRLGYLANFSFDRFKNAENGGVSNDSAIVADALVNKILLPVNLKSAKRDYNIISGEAKMLLRLNKDSLSFKGHYLHVGASGSISKTEYTDDASVAFYDTAYINQFVTHDSVRFSKFVPAAGYNFQSKSISFGLGASYDISRFADMDTSKVYESMILNQQFSWASNDTSLFIKQKFNYILNGFNAGNYKASLNFNYSLGFLKTIITANLISEQRSQDLFFKYYNANNFSWNNNLANNQSNLLDFKIQSHQLKLKVGCIINSQSHITVLDANSYPVQLNNAVTAMRVYAGHTLKLFRFYLVNQINYQTADSYAWALPSLYTQHQLYYQHLVKKNGMIWQLGVQADYIGEMERIAYNPALNSYVMNYSATKGGNYVFADVFFTLRFKDASFFIKSEHLNQGLSGANYSLLQNFYQRDRAFRFGLNWNFRD